MPTDSRGRKRVASASTQQTPSRLRLNAPRDPSAAPSNAPPHTPSAAPSLAASRDPTPQTLRLHGPRPLTSMPPPDIGPPLDRRIPGEVLPRRRPSANAIEAQAAKAAAAEARRRPRSRAAAEGVAADALLKMRAQKRAQIGAELDEGGELDNNQPEVDA